MSYEDKPLTGAMFKNGHKQTDKHPDYRGPFTGPNGEEMEIAAWLKTSAKGTKYMSVSVGPKFKKDSAPQDDAPLAGDPLSDVPF